MTVELGLLLSIVTIILGYLGYQLNRAKKQTYDHDYIRTESKQDARVEAQLDYISRGVDDIRIDLKANEKQIIVLGERVTRVEESSKQAHRRIDKVEGVSE